MTHSTPTPLPLWPDQDPLYERERRQYARPVPSRLFLSQWFEALGQPVDRETLVETFGLEDPDLTQGLERRLQAMRRDGELIQNRRNQWCLARVLPIITGRVRAERDGFGYLEPVQGGERIPIPPAEMATLMDGDRIQARIALDSQSLPSARLIDVIERAHRVVAGRYFTQRNVGFVTPYHPRLFTDLVVSPDDRKTVHVGDFVKVEILEYPKRGQSAVVQVLEILGQRETPQLGQELVMTSFSLSMDWPADVLAELAALEPPHPPYEEGRRDLRHLPLVTIDGEDARDFDDAVFAERVSGGGFRLLVAIADVSEYVRTGTALDREAERRGTSVYFPDRVIPMLPERLSNDLCSLRPGEDRWAYVADLELTEKGEPRRSHFYPAVIHSHARLTYEEVARALENRDPSARRRLVSVLDPLETLYALYERLSLARKKRGAIDFESREPRIVFGTEGEVEDIEIRQRTNAHRLIEECMILANAEVARWLEQQKVDVLYRIHPPPTVDRLSDLRMALAVWGLNLGGGHHPEPKDFIRLLQQVQKRPERSVIEMLMLRTLSRASYDPSPSGHFGLALRHYCHFTSPIRRYPDLLVHRGLRQKNVPRIGDATDWSSLAVHCSYTERRADEASRAALQWCQLSYLSRQIEESFDGLVTGVAGFGLFVELERFMVSGLLHISNLPDDYYHHDPKRGNLTGEHRGQVFALGDRLRVKILKIDLEEGKLDLGFVKRLGN
jgi:ribonuclease R